MLLYIKNLKYKILRTLRNSSNEEPGSLIAAKFGLWFCDWATCVGQHMGYHAQKKQALFSLKLFHFCLHGCWHFWFQSGTFQWWLPSSLIKILYYFIKVSFHFLSNCWFSRVIVHSRFTQICWEHIWCCIHECCLHIENGFGMDSLKQAFVPYMQKLWNIVLIHIIYC